MAHSLSQQYLIFVLHDEVNHINNGAFDFTREEIGLSSRQKYKKAKI